MHDVTKRQSASARNIRYYPMLSISMKLFVQSLIISREPRNIFQFSLVLNYCFGKYDLYTGVNPLPSSLMTSRNIGTRAAVNNMKGAFGN